MSIADKLIYLDATKNLLREALNAAGGNLTQETPFREYAGGWLRDQSASLILDFSKQQYAAKDEVSMFPDRVGFEDIVTFTRSTGGGRFNAQGEYEWVGPDEPRIDYDPVTGACRGLLIEEQRTRLNTAASNFESIPTTNLQAVATSNIVNGFAETKLIPSTNVGAHTLNIYPHAINSIVSRNSVIVRAGEYRWLTMTLKASYAELNDQFARFNLAIGTIERQYSGLNAKITDLGEGLYRCEVSAGNTGGASNLLRVAVESDISSAGYDKTAGDGTSGLYIYHAQCEDGLFATSPIIGEGAQVTRSADIASVKELSPWYNSEQGTLFAEVHTDNFVGAGQTVVYLRNTTWSGFRIYKNTATITTLIHQTSDGKGDRSVNVVAGKGLSRLAGAYSSDGIALSANGGGVSTENTPRTMFNPTALIIGQYANLGYWNGHIRSIRYFPRRLSNTDLQEITS